MNKLNFLLISLLFPRSSNCQDDRLEAEGSSIDDPGTPEAEAPEEDVKKSNPEVQFLKEKRKSTPPRRETESDPEVLFLEEKRKSTLPGRESDPEVQFLKEKKGLF